VRGTATGESDGGAFDVLSWLACRVHGEGRSKCAFQLG
jgi:hypothetical protein